MNLQPVLWLMKTPLPQILTSILALVLGLLTTACASSQSGAFSAGPALVDPFEKGVMRYLPADLLRSEGGTVVLSGDPVITNDCPFGEAVLFDGVDDQILLQETPLAGLNSFTVEVLIRPDWGATLEPRFLHIGDPGGGDRMMLEGRLVEGGGWALDSYLRAGESWLVLLDRELQHPVGEWAHVALVVENGQAKNYMNGQFELEGTLVFDPIDTGVVSIGARGNQRHWFKGAIHSVTITPRALKPEEFLPMAKTL